MKHKEWSVIALDLSFVAWFIVGMFTLSNTSLRVVKDFGPNPTELEMFVYVPSRLASAAPAIVVGLHWCTGSAAAFYAKTAFRNLADQYGFIVIYPSASSLDRCWDVHSNDVLTHGGGGDAQGIVSMVRYALREYHADPSRVFVTGHSSGGMMTNVLLGSYPDVFRAGAAFAGVPFSCFAGPERWNPACANGDVHKSGRDWGNAVRAAYPGYAGARPRIQLFQGMDDGVVDAQNLDEGIKQWTNVLGVSETPSSTEADAPEAPFVRKRYRDANGTVQVEVIAEHGQPHNLKIMAEQVILFFGLAP